MIRTARLAPDAAISLSSGHRAAASKLKSLADGQSQFAPFDGHQIHYLTAGNGKTTIIFIHCWAGNLTFWREQIPALADKARLILIDLPGHGRSDKPRADYTMDFFADAVLAVMRAARVEKAVLAGHSMGGAVVSRVHHHAPEKIAAVISVDGLLRRPRGTAEQAAQFIGQFRAPDYREHAKNFINSLFPLPGAEALREHVTAEMLQTPQHVMAGAMEGLFGANQPDWDLKKTGVPVLALNAKSSVWNGVDENFIRSLSPQTDYRLFEGVNHWLMLEKPAKFNAALVGMLQKFGLIEN